MCLVNLKVAPTFAHLCRIANLRQCTSINDCIVNGPALPLVTSGEWTCFALHFESIISMLLAKRDFTLRLANAMAKPQIHPYVVCLSDSVCPSSVVCDVSAPYSGGLTFREYFCTVCCGHCIHQLGLRTPTKVIPIISMCICSSTFSL